MDIMRGTTLETLRKIGNAVMTHRGMPLTELRKSSDITYSYLTKMVNELEAHGILESKRTSRERIITATKKGRKFFRLLFEITDMFYWGDDK